MKLRFLRKKLKDSKGQSILEFALIFPFIFFFIFIHVQLCITYIAAEYTNYVSYMSARTVLTNGHLDDRHVGVVNRYIPARLQGLLQINQPKLIKWNPQSGQFANATKKIEQGNQLRGRELGVEIEYSIPVFMPFLREFGENLRFSTKTVLGREPYHGGGDINSWIMNEPEYGDSMGKESACSSVLNDNGC
jgi:hypothetical protein